jgi:hypothetical protein
MEDRLETIKKVWKGCVPNSDIAWLIAEVERLRKELKDCQDVASVMYRKLGG